MYPIQKPGALLRCLVEQYTMPGELVVDPYTGSGTMLMAASACDRCAIGRERDPDLFQLPVGACWSYLPSHLPTTTP